MLGLNKKQVTQLEKKIHLCDSFINKDIDVEYYENEKEKLRKELTSLKSMQAQMYRWGSIALFVALFILLFVIIYWVLKQLF